MHNCKPVCVVLCVCEIVCVSDYVCMNFQHFFAYKYVPIFPTVRLSIALLSIFLTVGDHTKDPSLLCLRSRPQHFASVLFFFQPLLSNTGLKALHLEELMSTGQLRGEMTRQNVTEGQHLGLFHINWKLQQDSRSKGKGWERGFLLFQTVKEDKRKFRNAFVIFSVLIYAYQTSVNHFVNWIMSAKCL